MGLDRKNKNYKLEFIDVFVFHKRKISSPLKKIFSVIKRMTSEPNTALDSCDGVVTHNIGRLFYRLCHPFDNCYELIASLERREMAYVACGKLRLYSFLRISP